MRAADHILDLGPRRRKWWTRRRRRTYSEILKMPHSLTGRYLADELHIQIPSSAASPVPTNSASRSPRAQPEAHRPGNPLGMLVAITGVSGSGKSSLLHDVSIAPWLPPNTRPLAARRHKIMDEIEGEEFLDESSSSINPHRRTPRSNPVTYIKAFDIIRELFASLPKPASADSLRTLLLQRPVAVAKPARATVPSPSKCSFSRR